MNVWKKVKVNNNDEKYKRAKLIAHHLYKLGGPDLRGLARDELVELIEQTMKNITSAMKALGVTMEEATKAFQLLGSALEIIEEKENDGKKKI